MHTHTYDHLYGKSLHPKGEHRLIFAGIDAFPSGPLEKVEEQTTAPTEAVDAENSELPITIEDPDAPEKGVRQTVDDTALGLVKYLDTVGKTLDATVAECDALIPLDLQSMKDYVEEKLKVYGDTLKTYRADGMEELEQPKPMIDTRLLAAATGVLAAREIVLAHARAKELREQLSVVAGVLSTTPDHEGHLRKLIELRDDTKLKSAKPKIELAIDAQQKINAVLRTATASETPTEETLKKFGVARCMPGLSDQDPYVSLTRFPGTPTEETPYLLKIFGEQPRPVMDVLAKMEVPHTADDLALPNTIDLLRGAEKVQERFEKEIMHARINLEAEHKREISMGSSPTIEVYERDLQEMEATRHLFEEQFRSLEGKPARQLALVRDYQNPKNPLSKRSYRLSD